MAFLMAMLPVKLMGTSPKAKEDVTKTYLMLENLQELVAKKSLSAFMPLLNLPSLVLSSLLCD